MIAVLGATGHTGRVVVQRLLGAGREVRAVARSADRLRALSDQGADTAAGDIADAAFLAGAFDGAQAAYVVVSPDYSQESVRAYYNRLGTSIEDAIRRSELKRMVFLSSLGADLPSGTGFILGLRDLEQRFGRTGIDLLILRPGFFYENFYASLDLIEQQGINGGAIAPDVPLVITATADIGAAAARALADFEVRGTAVRELLGPRDYTMREATAILGQSIGRPDLAYVQFPPDAFTATLQAQAGFSKGAAEGMLEMFNALSAGRIRPAQERNPETTMPTTFETFAEELAAAYRARQQATSGAILDASRPDGP
jgi:uncharacterized protein YbjT (DUF2867 family)